MAMTPKQNQALTRKIELAIQSRDVAELALGYLRYEAVRRLNPRQFAVLCFSNVRLEARFDDLVDELVDELVVTP